MSIKVEKLTKTFGDQTAVDHISFEIAPGNIVGFLGPNGAGKSTTMKMLATFLTPTSGRAYIDGHEVSREPFAVRQTIGYLPEKNPLYYDMYVKEFLAFTAGVHRLGSEKKARIDEMIALTGLSEALKKKIGALSKGYKQRVGLAQAMIHNPKVLILDEPTSGLDPNQIMDIRRLIQDIGKEKTILLSTHIMQEVQAMCSRAIIIKQGKIVADDLISRMHATPQSKTSLLLELSQVIPAEELERLPHAQSVELVEGARRWLIHTDAPDALRKEVLAWSLKNDYSIQTLQSVTRSLEEVFRDLTSGEQPPHDAE